MNTIRKFFKLLILRNIMINTILGIILMVSLVLIYLNPNNRYVVFTACIAGGLINIVNGIKAAGEPVRKQAGRSYIMLGFIIIILGYIIIQFFMK